MSDRSLEDDQKASEGAYTLSQTAQMVECQRCYVPVPYDRLDKHFDWHRKNEK